MPMPRKQLDLREIVRKRLAETGTSQRELARRADVGQDKISLWLRGRCDLYGGRLNRILNALGPPKMTWPLRMQDGRFEPQPKDLT